MRENKPKSRENLDDLINDPDSYNIWSESEDEKESKLIRNMMTSHIWGDNDD